MSPFRRPRGTGRPAARAPGARRAAPAAAALLSVLRSSPLSSPLSALRSSPLSVLLSALAGTAIWGLPSAAAQAAGPPAPGPKVSQCVTCHGEQGISRMPGVPNLAGQPETYLRDQLKAYRSGKRQHEVMAVVAKSLSDADIAEVAGWFSGIEIQVRPRD